MNYSIKEVSEKTGLPASTLRYYEKEELLPRIERNENGIRSYTDADLDWISIITCLKNTDMPIKDIRRFVNLCAQGDQTLEERRSMVIAHQKAVKLKLKELLGYMDHINYKVDYYNAVCQAGSEKKVTYPEYHPAKEEENRRLIS